MRWRSWPHKHWGVKRSAYLSRIIKKGVAAMRVCICFCCCYLMLSCKAIHISSTLLLYINLEYTRCVYSTHNRLGRIQYSSMCSTFRFKYHRVHICYRRRRDQNKIRQITSNPYKCIQCLAKTFIYKLKDIIDYFVFFRAIGFFHTIISFSLDFEMNT